MKVLLVQDVHNLGMAGEIHEVADGYGRNYLIPRGLAVLATPGEVKQADVHRRRAEERRQRIAEEMASVAETVRDTTLLFQAKAGETGRLYGSVTSTDIAEKLSDVVGEEIDRRKIILDGSSIKDLGKHTVTLRLSADLVADFDVVVEAMEPEEEAEAAEAVVAEAVLEAGEEEVEAEEAPVGEAEEAPAGEAAEEPAAEVEAEGEGAAAGE